MASFFQPPAGGDPALNCSTSGFEVYCNEIIGDDDRFKNWYQILLVGVAAAALFFPILSLVLERTLNVFLSRSKTKPR